MKTSLRFAARCWLPRLGLGSALALSPLAHAVDGTITINGQITDSTCKINGNAPPADLLVSLPKIGASAMKNQGDVAGATVFTLKLTDCPTTFSGTVKAHFEPGATTDYDTGYLHAYTTTDAKTKASSIPITQASETQASNVAIQLANTDGSAIKVGAADNMAKGVAFSSSGDKKIATLNYLARYVKSGSGAITAGKIYTYVQYSIAYP